MLIRTVSRFLAFTLALAAAGCQLDKQEAPPLMGPSGFGLSIAITATPDVLPRDGSSISVIKVVARDAQGRTMPGQRVVLGTTAGTLSAGDVTTNGNGEATFELTSPELGSRATTAIVSVTPVGTNADNAATRTVSVSLSGPAVPNPIFTFTPDTPGQYDLVTFSAATTTLNGATCGSTCTYAWTFGDGSTATGQTATHRFQSQGLFTVTLTATGPGGVPASGAQTISIGAPRLITATITFSPTDPQVNDTVFFDGRSSTTPDGATIESYEWDFGNGQTASGATASVAFNAARSYNVRLVIRDSLGRTATDVKSVTVD